LNLTAKYLDNLREFAEVKMGNGFSLAYHPEVTPHPLKEPTFDPLYGFPNGRKQRG
jgi:hypothetical protein